MVRAEWGHPSGQSTRLNTTTRIPVIEKYRKEREVTDIDGTGTPDEVFARLRAAVEAGMHKAR